MKKNKLPTIRSIILSAILIICIGIVVVNYWVLIKETLVSLSLKPKTMIEEDVVCWDPSFGGKILKCFYFNHKNALNEWEEKIFKNRSLYSVAMQAEDGYLKAYSNKSSSGIFYRLGVNTRRYPYVSWKWKVVKFPESETKNLEACDWIEKDDYAARFYVIFPSLFFSRTKSLEYVWDKEVPEGTIKTSPYFKNIKIFVVESGEKNLNKWVFEERNIYEDYKKAFGMQAGSIGAIAIMTDTDNTLSTAEAHYDEIRVGYNK